MVRHRLLAVLIALFVTACLTPPSPIPSLSRSSVRPSAATPGPSPSPTVVLPTPVPTSESTAASAIVRGSVDRSSLEVSATYDAGLRVAVSTGDIAVRTVIAVRNDSGGPIDRLELNAVAARLGAMKLGPVTVDGHSAAAAVDDQTINVPLGGILPSGARATVTLDYTARLRHDLSGSDWLFSRVGGTLALYRWIPWVSRAVPFDRPNHGDPFVTPTSPAVHVSVTTDSPMVIASPGAAPIQDGLTWTFDVADVRDVAIVLAPDFTMTKGLAGGIPIRVYTRPGGLSGARVARQAELAIARLGDRLGVPYPWPAFTVVETEGGFGMESPGLIFVPKTTTAFNLAYLVHHETAHQWFYGLVGNDQQAEPFADEAAADMAARAVLGLSRASRCARAVLDRAITAYSQACYYEDVYIQGGLVLNDMRRAMGSARFWTAVRAYLEANRFGLAGTRQLLDSLRAASPADLLPILRSRFPSLYP